MLQLLVLAVLAADPKAQIVAADQARSYLIANGKGQATLLLGAAQGAPAALSVLTLAPGAEVPEHTHDGSAEILYVEEGRVEMTIAGDMFFAELGIDIAAARSGRRAFCRPCIDWSERRLHLAGAVGGALAKHLFDLNWIARVRDKRVVTITPKGRLQLARVFGVEPDHAHDHAAPRRVSA